MEHMSKWPTCGGGLGQKWDPCLGIFCQKPTHWAAHPRIAFLWQYPPPPGFSLPPVRSTARPSGVQSQCTSEYKYLSLKMLLNSATWSHHCPGITAHVLTADCLVRCHSVMLFLYKLILTLTLDIFELVLRNIT